MKKIGILCLLIGLAISFLACNGDETTTPLSETTTNQSTTEPPTSEGMPTITEEPLEFTFASGVYNFTNATDNLIDTFLASAENYLLDTMSGGIPLYTSVDYLVYNNRIVLPTDKYISILGYGAEFGSMTVDDSSVKMADGYLGESGDYTFRTTVDYFGSNYNQWMADTSSEEGVMSLYVDSLYDFTINNSLNGFDLVPSMAESEPIAIDSTLSEYGETISDVWEIPIKEDLEWYFSPQTDTTFLDSLDSADYVIDANDFVDTYKLAIDNIWFRGVSGGGNFIDGVHVIEGLEDYCDGLGSWEDVGIKVVNNNIQFTFIDDQEAWDVMYLLSSYYLSPINTALYNFLELDGDSQTNYGDSYIEIAYSGPYYISSVIEDIINLEENPVYHDIDKYFYTGFEFHITNDYDIIKELYDDEFLDYFESSHIDRSVYLNTDNVVESQSGTVYRLNLNATGTEESFNELFPDTDYTPEPILANQDFRLAMFYAIDREGLTETIGWRAPCDRYFTDVYLLSIKEGINYRYTEAGMSVGSDMSPETYGYDIERAKDYFNSALESLVALGIYETGTADNYSVITLNLNYIFSATQTLLANFIKDTFEDVLRSEEYYIRVNVTVNSLDFADYYWNFINVGDFDMFFGGLSSSLLCPCGILDQYCSDNRSDFLMNFGYDTSIPEIEIEYIDMFGVLRAEIWSFDAIASALTGEVYLDEGQEAENLSS